MGIKFSCNISNGSPILFGVIWSPYQWNICLKQPNFACLRLISWFKHQFWFKFFVNLRIFRTLQWHTESKILDTLNQNWAFHWDFTLKTAKLGCFKWLNHLEGLQIASNKIGEPLVEYIETSNPNFQMPWVGIESSIKQLPSKKRN